MELKRLTEWIAASCRKLRGTSLASTADNFAGGPVQGAERISYFVRSSKHIDKKTQCVRPEAFMPRRFDSRLETSVYRTEKLTDAAVWNICRTYYEELAQLTAKGRGDGTARAVMTAGLSFDPNGRPHPRHADIIGWLDLPDTQDRDLKHHWMNAARRFAGNFIFKPRPS